MSAMMGALPSVSSRPARLQMPTYTGVATARLSLRAEGELRSIYSAIVLAQVIKRAR